MLAHWPGEQFLCLYADEKKKLFSVWNEGEQESRKLLNNLMARLISGELGKMLIQNLII